MHGTPLRIILIDKQPYHLGKVFLCVWTFGLLPNPTLRSFGLPLTPDGRIIVDASYRVKGAAGVYSIGDCAHITF